MNDTQFVDLNTDGFNPFSLAPYELFPDDLKQEARWLVYKLELDAEKGKNDKIPYNPMTGFKANNPALGVTFDVVSKLDGFSGPGIYVEPPYIVIDIDDCRDSESGVVAPWALEIIRQLDTYAEASPSGTGVHIWMKGKKPGGVCRKGIEIYSTRRFMTVTGKPISGAPFTVNERDVADVYNRMLAGEFQSTPSSVDTPKTTPPPTRVKAQIVPKGLRTTDLYSLLMYGTATPEKQKPCVIENEGGSISYESRSEADMALCVLLAQRHDNPDAIDTEFRKSSLYRDKWEERKDYRERTINAAVKFATNAVVSEAVEDEIEPEVMEEPLPEFPKFSGSLMELCESQFPEIPFEFKMMAAITHFGLIRSGLDKLESEPHLQSRFYTCLIKSPGWGKTAALNEIRKCMGMVARYSVTSSVDSGPALVDELADCAAKIPPMEEDKSARLLLDPDEMSGLFEKSKVSPSSRNTLFNELLKLYEANRTGNRSRKAGKSQVDDAHLAIIGGATEEGYPNMWTGTGGGSTGLQSRMVLITTTAPRMPIKKSIPDTTALSAAISRLQKQAGQPGQVVRIDDAASKMLQDWWTGSVRDKGSETRVEDMVKRLLIVLAVTNDTKTIGRDLMAQAIQFGDYVIAVRERFNPADSHSWTQAFENQIIAVAQRRKIAMTMNDYRRMVQPNRKPGGLGPFIQAWKNVLAVGLLKSDGTTHKGTLRYRL